MAGALFLLFVLAFLIELEYRQRKINRSVDELLRQKPYDCNVISIYDRRGRLKNEKMDTPKVTL